MKLSPDDPRLTAYALHELPPDEAARLESDLEACPEARAALEETRALATLLQEGFQAETMSNAPAGVADALRKRLAATPPTTTTTFPDNVLPIAAVRFRWMPWLGLAAAAALLVSAVSLFFPDREPALRLASAPPPTVGFEAPPDVQPAPEVLPPASTPLQAASDPSAAVLPAPAARESAPAPSGPMSDEQRRRYGLGPAPAPTAPVLVAPRAAPDNGLGARPNSAPGSSSAPSAGPAVTATSGVKISAHPTPVPNDSKTPTSLRARYGLSAAGGALPDPQVQTAPAAPSPTRRPVALQLMKRSSDASMTQLAEVDSLAPSPAAGRAAQESRLPKALVAEDPYARDASRRLSSLATISPAPLPAPQPGITFWRVEPPGPSANPGYIDVGENPFRAARDEPLSTFSLDVDTGSYANLRRFLNAGQFPRPEAVRLEEMINYFAYDAPPAMGDHPFAVGAEVASCPWSPNARLVRLAIKARELAGPRAAGNFVFLVDVSGSMQPSERLPLLKQALKALVRRLAPSDRIAIVTYASSAGVHLPSTSGEDRETILAAIDRLQSGGSTNGEGGIRSAYDVARAHFIPGGVNRVLLCTDGDFNVGVSDQNQLVDLIADQAKSGVFLTTLGVGTDNFKDALMRRLADRGNGSYHYLDSFEEAQRVLIHQMDATFVTVARDVKAQVEFNPAKVGAWRLLGYEKRLLAHQDFNDDKKDAGEIGAGHGVTVLYEILPPGAATPAGVDPLKYQRPAPAPAPPREIVDSPELLTLKLRYQKPEGSRSTLLELPVADDARAWNQASADFRFAAAVASFGMILRHSPHRGSADFASVLELARGAVGRDPDGWRAEFLSLVRKAQDLTRGPRGQ